MLVEGLLGKVKKISTTGDGDIECAVVVLKGDCPADVFLWDKTYVVVRKQEQKPLPLDEEKERQIEVEQARQYEALGERPGSVEEHMGDCDYCRFQGDNDGECLRVGDPDCLDGELWQARETSAEKVLVDAEDPVEICLCEQCNCFTLKEGPVQPDLDREGCCLWPPQGDRQEIRLGMDGDENWLKHPACLEATMKAKGIPVATEVEPAAEDAALAAQLEKCPICPDHIELDGVISCGLPAGESCKDIESAPAPGGAP